MEETIAQFRRSIGSFCNNLQSSSDALKQSVERRPIPLDSASSIFIQSLNRRVSSASSDLNLLESMTFGTVSFEELLGHCNEVYKNNQNRLLQLQDRLRSSGYVPELEIDDDEADLNTRTSFDFNLKDGPDPPSANNGPVSVTSSILKSLEEDPLMNESLSLKSLGLSEVCLATLASEANSKTDDPGISMGETIKYYGDRLHNMKSPDQNTANNGVNEGEQEPAESCIAIVKVSRDDYEGLPSYMKCLTSWEDLLTAVEKINSSLKKKEKTKETNYFRQDEITSMDLGPKARTYLLLLTRMNQLAVETIDGLVSYKVL